MGGLGCGRDLALLTSPQVMLLGPSSPFEDHLLRGFAGTLPGAWDSRPARAVWGLLKMCSGIVAEMHPEPSVP